MKRLLPIGLLSALFSINAVSGNQLIVKSTRPDEHWRVAWERY